MKAKVINPKMLGVLLAISIGFISWGVASWAYHQPGIDCTDCHDMHGETSNIKLIAESIDYVQPGGESVEFLVPPGDYADGLDNQDPNPDQICEVCHTNTNYYRTDGTGVEHYPGGDCSTCHSHCDEFLHGAPGTGCDENGCHGYDGGAGTVQSHSTHTEGDADDVKGPMEDCSTCHDTDNYPLFKDGKPLETTTACDDCHSTGGAFGGVAMAKANWTDGIYEADSETLKSGKEQWCATCHDDDPALSKPGEESVSVVVDNPDSQAGWTYASGYSDAYDNDILWIEGAGSASYSVTWTPDIPVGEAGDYDVYVWMRPGGGARTTNAKYTVTYSGGAVSDPIIFDQQVPSADWYWLGNFAFDEGTGGNVVLTDEADGYVIADAVWWDKQ